jgi:glycosyltransferase involved in cell wall biosynthesis
MTKVTCISTVPTLTARQQIQLKTLRETGFRVKVLCWDRIGMHARKEERNGIKFLRISPSNRKNMIKHDTQCVSTLWGYSGDRGIKTKLSLLALWLKMLRELARDEVDIIVCFHYVLLPLAVLVGAVKKAKIVYDISEFNIDSVQSWMPSWLRAASGIVEQFEDICVRRVDGVTCVPDRNSSILKRHYNNCKNIQVIFNVPEISNRIDPALHNDLSEKYDNKYVVVYAGPLKLDKGMDHALEAIKIVRDRYREIKLVLIGSCFGDDTAEIEKYVADNSLEENVDIVTFQPYERLETYYACGDIGINLRSSYGNYDKNLTIGNSRKNFDYLKASLAVIIPEFGEMGRLIEEEDCGMIVKAWEGGNVAKAILYLMENPTRTEAMRKNGHKAFLTKYNWDIEKKKLLEVYKRL